MSAQPPTDPLVYAPKRAAELLGVHPNTIYGLIKSGRLKSVKIGRAHRIPADSLAGLVNGQSA